MEKSYRDQIHPSGIPAHIAVIMDGNGRWAKKRGLPRIEGHKKGAEVIERLIDCAIELGIRYVSVYAFSTENWSRPRIEIQGLWKILDDFFMNRLPALIDKGVRIVHSGSMKRLPKKVQDSIRSSVERSRKNTKIVLNLCINYGGQQEVLDAVNEWSASAKKGEVLTAAKLCRHLYVPELPEVDLMIRTSGEQRVSNFLLWQASYAELVFMDVLWPDFEAEDMYCAVYEFQKRSRRFGGI
jgi:undecaprenyl diphosphate synthase